jgi:GT2 family glycosyltransferase
MKEKILYAVIILNYNTPDDTIIACESIINNATTEKFRICIVDNASCSNTDKLSAIKNNKVSTLFLPKNKGYANGNNDGIEYINSLYDPEYIVIMNPDVLILNKGTIEGLIEKHSKLNNKYCGISPIIWNPNISNNPYRQITASKIPNFSESLLLMTNITRIFNYKHFMNLVYMDKMPYNKPFDAEVVSGAFFIINSSYFKQIGYFDNRTFLYGEERLIGYKLRSIGKIFCVCPKYIVQHEGGKSTKSKPHKITIRDIKLHMASEKIYLSDYLHANKTKIFISYVFACVDYLIKKIYYTILNLQNNISNEAKRTHIIY